MAIGAPPSRREIRTRMKVPVELCSFENVIYEVAYTVDVSPHGARILTKSPWQSNQRLTVRPVQGKLCSTARVAYCRSVEGGSFAIGVELGQPTADWSEQQKRLA